MIDKCFSRRTVEEIISALVSMSRKEHNVIIVRLFFLSLCIVFAFKMSSFAFTGNRDCKKARRLYKYNFANSEEGIPNKPKDFTEIGML